MISTVGSGKLTQSNIDEGRSLLSALRKLDMNVAKWVKSCLDECGTKENLRAEWKRHLGLDHDHAGILIGCYEAWTALPDRHIWVAVGLQGVNKLRTLRSDQRAEVVEKLKEGLQKGQTIAPEDLRKIVDKKRGARKANRVVRFVAGKYDAVRVSSAVIDELKKVLEEHGLVEILSEAARLELGLAESVKTA